jgi:hypothetical protein
MRKGSEKAMDNGRISLRQAKRLFFFQVLGPGLLLLPEALAQNAGKDGILVLGLAVLAGIFYLEVAAWFWDKRKGKQPAVIASFIYGIYLLLLGGYATFLLTDMVRSFLLPEESFSVIGALIVLLAAYGCRTGLEGMARAFELLFWPVLVLLLFLFALGMGEMRLTNILPMGSNTAGWGIGIGLCFVVFGVSEMLCFSPELLEEQVTLLRFKKEMQKTIAFSGVLLMLLYEMLLGSFGTLALADAKWPIMLFSGNLVLPGGFLRRQEALVAGVCFVAVLALTGSCIWRSWWCFQGMGKKRFISILVPVLIFLLCLWECYHAGDGVELLQILLWLFPVVLVLPFFHRPRAATGMSLLLVAALLCTGCSLQELEDKSFPMVIALGAEDGNCTLTYNYMDLSKVSEKEKNQTGSDELQVSSSTLQGAMSLMNQKTGKSMDLNHAKILLLEQSFLEDASLVEQLIREGNQGAVLSGNLPVLVTEDLEAVTGLQDTMDEDLGSYLEELIEGNTAYQKTGCFALKTWISDWYQENTLTLLPRICVEEEQPVLKGYYGYMKKSGTKEAQIYELSTLEGLCAGICQGVIGQLDISMGNGMVRLENPSVSYEFSRSNSRVICYLTITGDINLDKSVNCPSKGEIEEYLCSIIRNAWDNHIDLTNSYTRLNCHDRDIYQEYAGDYQGYWKDLSLQVEGNFRSY